MATVYLVITINVNMENNMKRVLTCFASILILSGCSTIYHKPVITAPVSCVQIEKPLPSPLVLNDVGRVVVVTPTTATKVFSDIEKAKGTPTLICVSPEGYKALSINLEKIQGHIQVLRETAK